MRRGRAAGVLVAVLLTTALADACRREPASGSDALGSGARPTAPGYGVRFLGLGDCSSRGPDVGEVPCTSERAVARVIARHQGRPPPSGPVCPDRTDFVLHISQTGAATGRSYACMRNLEPPHPGDPGRGGGPHTVVGDCVAHAGAGQVRETACDGSGERRPQFRVESAVRRRAQCPPTTDLYVELGGVRPVGCAHRV
ncbi:hypothetical protein [Streptomyces sp. NPDC050504]|uniref:hypothetical protein n=1 Tax=Streptomyces sp. NPDC050504 TaxID=3365618 RepID=UPI0037B99E49